MKAYILPEAVREALLQYFAQRPWGEADPAVRALLSLEEAPNDAE